MCANILVTINNSLAYPYPPKPPGTWTPVSSVVDVLNLSSANYSGSNLFTPATLQLLDDSNVPVTLLSSEPSSWPTNGPTGIWQDTNYNLHVAPASKDGGAITLNFAFADAVNIRPLGICFSRTGGATGTAAGNMPLKTVSVFAPGLNTSLQPPASPPLGYVPLLGSSIQVTDTDATLGIGWEYYLLFQVVNSWNDPTNPNTYGANCAALGIIDPGVENDGE